MLYNGDKLQRYYITVVYLLQVKGEKPMKKTNSNNEKVKKSIIAMIENINSEKLLQRVHDLVQMVYIRG